MKDSIRHLIQQALTRLTADGVLPEGLTPAIQASGMDAVEAMRK